MLLGKRSLEYTRLKEIMTTDKAAKPAKLDEVLRSELYSILRNYLETDSEHIELRCDAGGRGVVLHVEVNARSVKPFLSLPEM